LLLIGPGLVEAYGSRNDRVASQVDVVPTVMSLLGAPYQHQCWGRDVIHREKTDQGFAVIKPSGNDPTVAIVSGNKILVRDINKKIQFYQYQLSPVADVQAIDDPDEEDALLEQMTAYVSTALASLKENNTAP
jgi:phosphoglycerol transferase MdoB-like AlkP superfamily enzyme